MQKISLNVPRENLEAMVDLLWYQSHVPEVTSAAVALNHYFRTAGEERLSPTPYLLSSFYLKKYSDLRKKGIDPYEHFIGFGIEEGRDPHPLFMSGWYRTTYKIGNDIAPFTHYLNYGWKLGYRPHPGFWSDWYLKQNKGIWGDPLYHYLTEGCQRGALPNPLFDPDWYKQQIKREIAPLHDLFTDYLMTGALKDLSPHPLFDPLHYAKLCAMAGIPLEEKTAYLHYLTSDGATDPHPLFDTNYYLQQTPNRKFNLPLADYVTSGANNHNPHPFFMSSCYLEYRPDVREANLNPLVHYLKSGYKEYCRPHPLFDNGFYVKNYPDIHQHNIVPLPHFVSHGWHEGRSCRPVHPPILTAQRRKHLPAVVIPRGGETKGASRAATLTKGVFAHVFYPDLLDQIIAATNNIPAPCRVFLSTDTPAKVRMITALAQEKSVHAIEVRLTENRGRDIAPMIVGYADRLREVELGIHIHTKKSRHYAKQFDAWRDYLINSNLGSPEIVANLLALFDSPEVGMIAPVDYGPIDPLIQWGGNLETVNTLVRMMTNGALTVTADNLLELPSGSMFWFRTAALAPLLDLALRNYHFEPEAGQVDGTLAHAIERSFFYTGEIAGFGWLRFRIGSAGPYDAQREAESCIQHILPTRTRRTALVATHPETLAFTCTASRVDRPRLTLLIPTAEHDKGYAGVSEALRLFNGIRQALGENFDSRIVATDTPFSNQFQPDEGQIITDLYHDGAECRDIVCDGTRRSSMPMAVRQNDIFVATAWWTAVTARDLRAWQTEHFGATPQQFIYLIQDYESGFYPWSTKFMLAESTYQNVHDVLPVFNTGILADFFQTRGYFSDGYVYQPPINERIMSALDRTQQREKIALIYMRPHAQRNCLEFAEALIEHLCMQDRVYWRDWQFLAIGEDFSATEVLKTQHIRVLGRLTLQEYADYLSRARLGLSLMVSPHPSYPPLEMAEAGLLVLTNTYANKDLATLHENIRSFDSFTVPAVSAQLRKLADEAMDGVTGKAKVDWFFGGATNYPGLMQQLGERIIAMGHDKA